MQRRPTNTAQEKNTSSGQKEMDAIELLKQDHERVTELFGQYAGAEVEERQAIAQRTFKELEIHGILEEELFYPALQNQGNPDEFATLPQGDIDINGEAVLDPIGVHDRQDDETFIEDDDMDEDETEGDDIISAAFEDHQAVKQLIHRLKSLDPQTSDFHQGMIELEAIVSDHVVQEEEIFFVEATG